MQKETIIKPSSSLLAIDWKEIWDYRELFYIFSWRDIKIRYKQTYLGIAWVLFQPLASTGIFSIFFGKIAKIPSDGLPYPLFVLAGLVIWSFFSSGFSSASQSLLANESIMKKIYFPRLIIPISSIITSSVDFLIMLPVLFFAVLYYGYRPNPIILLFLPLLIVILFMTISGLGMFVASLNVKYRDVRFIVPFFVQIGLFITPVIYPLSVIYDYRRWLLILNPLTGIIETFRTLVSGGTHFDFGMILVSVIVSLALFLVGLVYFHKTETYFADIT